MSAPAQAGWRDDLGVFRIGMVSTGPGAEIEGAATIRNAYARALGMPVEIFVARDFAALIDAQASSRVEYAIHSAASYATAWQLCNCIEPVAAPVSDDGSTGIRSVLVARQGGPASPGDLASYKLALGPADSAGGYLVPLAEFTANGAPLTGTESFLVKAASETEALRMVADGSADALFGYVPSTAGNPPPRGGTLARLEADGTGRSFKVLWTSELLVNGPHAVRTRLDDEAKTALRSFLTGLRERDPKVYELLERSFGGGFAARKHDDYKTAIEIVRAASLRQAPR